MRTFTTWHRACNIQQLRTASGATAFSVAIALLAGCRLAGAATLRPLADFTTIDPTLSSRLESTTSGTRPAPNGNGRDQTAASSVNRDGSVASRSEHHKGPPTPGKSSPALPVLRMITINAYQVFSSQVLTNKQLIDSSQAAESISRSTIGLLGPEAGGTQALSMLPNVYVSGYNNYSETGRSQVSIRGLKVGYNSVHGDLASQAITFQIDGVPHNGIGQYT